MVRQFRDKAFQTPLVKDDWRKFLSYYIAEILPDEFGSRNKDTELKKQWMDIVEHTKQANSLKVLNFLS